MNPEKHLAPMAAPPRISIVIPAYNEAARLPGTLATLDDYLRARGETWELIVVVEKSADETLELAKRAAAEQGNFRVLENEQRRGKGYSVRRGMLAAEGDLIFYMDADLSVPVEDITAYLAFAERNPEVDVLVANRHHRLSCIEKSQNAFRRALGLLFNSLIRMVSPVNIRDTQCGFKAFRRAAARAVFAQQRIEGFAFDVEALLRAEQLGLEIRDLPVRWKNSEQSTVRPIRDGLRMLRDVLRLRWTLSLSEPLSTLAPSSEPEVESAGR